jgi:hypothetical protein
MAELLLDGKILGKRDFVADKERLSVDEVQRISHFRVQIPYAIEQGMKSARLGINLHTRARAAIF